MMSFGASRSGAALAIASGCIIATTVCIVAGELPTLVTVPRLRAAGSLHGAAPGEKAPAMKTDGQQ